MLPCEPYKSARFTAFLWLPLKAFHVSDAFARNVFPVCSDTPGWIQKAGSPSA